MLIYLPPKFSARQDSLRRKEKKLVLEDSSSCRVSDLLGMRIRVAGGLQP
jgi:hypothetical protein